LKKIAISRGYKKIRLYLAALTVFGFYTVSAYSLAGIFT
jgi:hypothetical protein